MQPRGNRRRTGSMPPWTDLEVHRRAATGINSGAAVALLVLISHAVSQPAPAAPGDQLLKLTAGDAAQGDLFGGAIPADVNDRTTHGVALQGNWALVGAPGDDTLVGRDAGSAYLLDATTGQQIQKLTPRDAGPGQTFGSAVAIDGSQAVVGAAHQIEGAAAPGAAYVLDLGTGDQQWKLTPGDALDLADGFGWSVDIDAGVAIVGAPFHPGPGRLAGGSAYLFDVTTGRQLHQLTPHGPEGDDWFGNSVSISGNTALVGAWGDGQWGEFAGAAYLFDVATGQQRMKLTAPEAEAFEQFGQSVSIDGYLAVVGAPNDDNENGDFSGTAYVFDASTGHLLGQLVSDDAQSDDRFGWSVSIRGTSVVVGATGDRDHGFFSGSAYLLDAVTGQQQQKLTADDAAENDQFGWAVAVDSGRALIAAPMDDDACPGDPACQSGSAYLMQLMPARLMPGDANQDLSFDQLDLIRVLQAAKYLTGQLATWGEGDWDGAPGGSLGDPPAGNGRFDQRDIVAALATGKYLTGPYAAAMDIEPAAPAGPDTPLGLGDLAAIGSARPRDLLGPVDGAFVPVPEPCSEMLIILGAVLLRWWKRGFGPLCRQ